MPDFTFSTAMTASQVDLRPLANWKYRVPRYRYAATVLLRATTVDGRVTIFAGGQEIQQKSPIAGGGVAGNTPIPQTTPVIQFFGDPLDEITLSIDNAAAGTPTIDGYINVEPV